MQKTLGGDRLGAGKRQKINLHGYGRSTHNMGYVWRSTMAPGTLVPFMTQVALPGDTWDIDLDADVKTHPTIGPLFGSYKVQLDVFEIPVRLYNSWLHNNRTKIGMNMEQVKLPQMLIAATQQNPASEGYDIDNSQINPSTLLAYLGIRGVGINPTAPTAEVSRYFNALWMLMYWDAYKQYYSNKQEEIGAMIDTPVPTLVQTIVDITIGGTEINTFPLPFNANNGMQVVVTKNAGAYTPMNQIMIVIAGQQDTPLSELAEVTGIAGNVTSLVWRAGSKTVLRWRYITANEVPQGKIQITTFPLENIDKMRDKILAKAGNTTFYMNEAAIGLPYTKAIRSSDAEPNYMLSSQQGLALKTYQSDLFNNWLSTEWIDGAGGITERTAVDTTEGSFTLDTLLLANKVYDLLNRVAVSGGTYDDWMESVWAVESYRRAETPVYMGGLSKELVFQEVVSNSESAEGQPLGTLAGKGVLAKKHKGGHVVIKPREISYVLGLVSLTPRIDYSQGNNWDTQLKTLDDYHKPQLDEIGFQELITEQMAWWDTTSVSGTWTRRSAGKQPAWINYMTNVNVVRGNFAIRDNEMWMTLNRRYEKGSDSIQDLTTYIDPSKYNQIFAETQLDAQNFWVQIAVDATARRVMSNKVMPNL